MTHVGNIAVYHSSVTWSSYKLYDIISPNYGLSFGTIIAVLTHSCAAPLSMCENKKSCGRGGCVSCNYLRCIVSMNIVNTIDWVLIVTIHLDIFYTNVVGCIYVTMCPWYNTTLVSMNMLSTIDWVVIVTIHLDIFYTNVVSCIYVTMCPCYNTTLECDQQMMYL